MALRGISLKIESLRRGLSALEEMRTSGSSEAGDALSTFEKLLPDDASSREILAVVANTIRAKILGLSGIKDAREAAKALRKPVIDPEHFVIPEGKDSNGQPMKRIECSKRVSRIMAQIFPNGGGRYLMVYISLLLAYRDEFPGEYMGESELIERSGYSRFALLSMCRLLEGTNLTLEYDPTLGYRIIGKS